MAKKKVEIRKEWDTIYKNEELKHEFLQYAIHLSTKEILWAEVFINRYPEKFVLQMENSFFIPFCHYVEDKFDVVENKIQNWLENKEGKYEHPYITYYYLQRFLEEVTGNALDASLLAATRETLHSIKAKGKKGKTVRSQEREKKEWWHRLQKIRKKLNLPEVWSSYSSRQIQEEILEYFEEFAREYHNIEKEKLKLEIELERYRVNEQMPEEYKKQLEMAKAQNQQLQKDLLHERSRNQILEKEIQRLTEMIIENPKIVYQQEEIESLKREYQLLSEKYDLLVSKNIELRNLLEQQNQVKSLHEILNRIRDRINRIIKTGGLSEEVMIIKIKNEIQELQRARIYLGKALYDVGLLYLRLGRKEEAIRELRAAKELGVEDPEVNRFIGQSL